MLLAMFACSPATRQAARPPPPERNTLPPSPSTRVGSIGVPIVSPKPADVPVAQGAPEGGPLGFSSTEVAVPTREPVVAISGSGADDVWWMTAEGSLWRFDGVNARRVDVHCMRSAQSNVGGPGKLEVSASDVWVTGEIFTGEASDLLVGHLRRNGKGSWDCQQFHRADPLLDMVSFAAGEAFVITGDGLWSSYGSVPPISLGGSLGRVDLRPAGVFMLTRSHGFVTASVGNGAAERFFEYGGALWVEREPPKAPLLALAEDSRGRLWALTRQDTDESIELLQERSWRSWRLSKLEAPSVLAGNAALSPPSVWLARSGALVRVTETGLSTAPAPFHAPLALWSSLDGSLWGSGIRRGSDSGVLVHFLPDFGGKS